MKRHFYFALLSTLVSMVWLLSAAAFAQAPPSGDSYVASSTPTTNYGPAAILPLQSGVRSYIRFDLSGIPANATVQKATIRLFVDGFTAPGSFDVYRINSAWDETTLTWSNKPVLGASATGNNPVPITAANSRNFVLVDITQLVKNWVNGTVPNNGIALALTTTAGSFSFDSKENTAVSHEPVLEIAIPGAQGAQGPQGAQGQTGATGPQGAQGLQGATGSQGPVGPIGPQGPQGPAGQDGTNGTNGSNGVSFIFRNAFDNSATYAANDVVSYSGSSYIAIAANQGPNNPTPDTNPSAWSLMAQEGAQGQTGIAGATGPQGSQGPQGQTGATGPTGPQGPQGIPGDMNPGSPYYIQNGTSQQTASFNVDGDGTVGGTLTATTAVNTPGTYNIGGTVVLTTNGESVFVAPAPFGGSPTLTKSVLLGYSAGHGGSGNADVIIGDSAAGFSHYSGTADTLIGYHSATSLGGGGGNTFLGANTGLFATTAANDIFIGSGAGGATTTGSSDIYIGSGGPATENNTIRIGSTGQQNQTFIAGINDQQIITGSPVWIDANGMLGIGSGGGGGGVTSFNTRTGAVTSQTGDYDFTQISGTLGDTQLSGRFTGALTLVNLHNYFVGNGGGLYNVPVDGGSSNYIQNGPSQQTNASFNIDGDGTVGGTLTANRLAAPTITATTAFNTLGTYQISGATILTVPSDGSQNAFLGLLAGNSNAGGVFDTFLGSQAGIANTSGSQNTYVGQGAGISNAAGNNNTFIGNGAGAHSTAGSDNTFLGNTAGMASTTGSSNIYIASRGVDVENNTIRIGTPGTGSGQQNQTFIAGIAGQTIASGSPVWVDANGLLGIAPGSSGNGVTSFNTRTGAVTSQGGDYNFSQLTGTLQDSQLSGTYSSALNFSNAGNSFIGNGAGLTNVPVSAGSPNYIQNGTTQQASSDFNISGNGTVGGTLAGTTAVNTNGMYQISGHTVVSAPSDGNSNTYVGLLAGSGISTPLGQNTFLGYAAGFSTTSGRSDTFVGRNAGYSNATGTHDVYIGTDAGYSQTTGIENVGLGASSGVSITTGNGNSLVGFNSGLNLTTGSDNLLLGLGSGGNISTGSSNILLANPGQNDESNTIRIGSSGTGVGQQTAVYIAGVNSQSIVSGSPVWVDANGMLGIGSGNNSGGVTSFNTRTGAVTSQAGDYSFSQLSGSVSPTQLSGTYTNALVFSNANNTFTGSGAGLTALSAGSLSSGTLPSGRLTGTYSSAVTFSSPSNSFTGSGAGLTALNASNLGSGTLPSARLSGTYASAVTFSSASNSFTGNGSGLTSVTASILAAGTYGNALIFSNASNSFTGNGAGLTNVPITSGSTFYIQNGSSQQASSNFNVSGNGTLGGTLSAATVNTTNNYQIGNSPVLTASQSAGSVSVGLSNNNGGSQNTIVGTGIGLNGVGSNNTFVGYSIAGLATPGTNNTAIGSQSAGGLTGSNNTFLGVKSGVVLASGSNNTFLGANSGFNLFSGNSDIYLANGGVDGENNVIRIGTQGTSAGQQNQVYIAGINGSTISNGSPVLVDSAGKLGTGGGNNFNITGNYQIGGVSVLSDQGSANLLVGPNAGATNAGTGNTLLGNSAGAQVTTGSFNTILGNQAATGLTTGSSDIFVGSNGFGLQGTSNSIFIGNQGSGTGQQNATYIAGILGGATLNGIPVFIDSNGRLGTQGGQSLVSSFNGRAGIVVPAANDYSFSLLSGSVDSTQLNGTYSSVLTFSNSGNSFIGANFNTTGTYQINGNNALSARSSNSNLSVGLFNASVSSGSKNTYVGIGTAQFGGSSSNNTMLGYLAGEFNSGSTNTYIGASAGVFAQSGNDNSVLGANAGANLTSGGTNTLIGSASGNQITTGSRNVFIGYAAANQITTGSDNIYVNSIADSNSSSESNTIRIGIGGSGSFQQNRAFIAGIAGTSVSGGVNVVINGNGQLGWTGSSRRFKDTILDMGSASSKLFQLRPVTFFYKPQFDDGSHILQYGLIAEEVAEIYPDLVVYDKDGQPETVRYHLLAPMLLNELQKQHEVVRQQQDVIRTQQRQLNIQQQQIELLQQNKSAQQQQIDSLQGQNAEFQQRLSRLEALMGQHQAVAQK